MITASHNPASDDGYKIYWENACQIIPPHDLGISNSIQKNLQPWIDYSTLPLPPIEYIDDQIIPQYMTHAYSCLHLNNDDINKVYFHSFILSIDLSSYYVYCYAWSRCSFHSSNYDYFPFTSSL